MTHRYREIAFTDAVRAVQEELGSAAMNAEQAVRGAENDRLGVAEVVFLTGRDSFYLASLSETGWPYVQHRGGPKGFVRVLDETGVCLVPVPEAVREDLDILGTKACQQYALKEFVENLVLLDTGPAKLMTPHFPLEQLRRIPGMERARFEDPLGGGKGNSVRFLRFARCDASLRAAGPVANLFCAGERGGPMVGHTEALVTGALAGHNGVRSARGLVLASPVYKDIEIVGFI